MRTIAGALLIVAASICLGAVVIAESLPPRGATSASAGISAIAAVILGLWGLILLVAGFRKDK
jgi:hypothetical protein